ncbi:XisI protein [Spirosoma soli]|uniref:XisI protein n=1 Tax=Spirosoma soli TaxID=1770529 RepID=A0ABW5M9B7_9BACT
MASLTDYSGIVQRLLDERKAFVERTGLDTIESIHDTVNDRYLLIINTWNGEKRSYGVFIHIDIVDGKIWIQRDGTEDGVIDDLIKAGVPKEHIVLAYRSPFVRQFTGFAVS